MTFEQWFKENMPKDSLLHWENFITLRNLYMLNEVGDEVRFGWIR